MEFVTVFDLFIHSKAKLLAPSPLEGTLDSFDVALEEGNSEFMEFSIGKEGEGEDVICSM